MPDAEHVAAGSRVRWAPSLLFPAALALVASVGAALRLRQYFAGGSLWIDEATLARNILARPLARLLDAPLADVQLAPRGFLAAAKASTALFGAGEAALRAVPLVGSLASLLLFCLLARRVLGAWAAIFGAILFALDPRLIHFAAQAKQYSTDVAATLLVLLAAVVALDTEPARPPLGARPPRSLLLLSLAGVAAGAVSQSAVLVLAAVGVALLAVALAARDFVGAQRVTLLVGVPWAMCAVIVLVDAERAIPDQATKVYLDRFWEDGFMPPPWSPLWAAEWLFDRVQELLGTTEQPWVGALYLGLMAFGVWHLARRAPRLLPLLVAPILVALTASATHQYPITGRLALFLVAPTFLLVAAGVDAILARAPAALAPATLGAAVERAARTWPRRAGAAAAAALAAFPVQRVVRQPPPYALEDIKPALSYVRGRLRAGDAVYVYYAAGQAFLYYASRAPLRAERVVLGGCHRGEPQRYLAELDEFRGRRRVWLLFTGNGTLPREERALMLAYLDSIGTRIASDTIAAVPPPGVDQTIAAAYLYDLGDSARLRRAAAEGFAAARRDVGSGLGWTCFGTLVPTRFPGG